MIGSTIFSRLTRLYSVELIGKVLLAVSAISLSVPFFLEGMAPVFGSFLMFEICCGVYFPTYGTLRGKYIPEHSRSAIMNFFRYLLNINFSQSIEYLSTF
jgi:hypothetical protein